MKHSRTRKRVRRLLFDATLYTRTAVETAAGEFPGAARISVLGGGVTPSRRSNSRTVGGDGAITVEFSGDEETELEFGNAALLHTIEEKRR